MQLCYVYVTLRCNLLQLPWNRLIFPDLFLPCARRHVIAEYNFTFLYKLNVELRKIYNGKIRNIWKMLAIKLNYQITKVQVNEVSQPVYLVRSMRRKIKFHRG